MKIKFFKIHAEYSDLRKDGKYKVKFGLFFIVIGLFVFFADYFGINDVSVSGYSSFGKIFAGLLSALYISLGKWISSMIFYIIGLIFIIWGIKDIRKVKAH